jgi:DNA recombination protein RmuC
MPLGINIAIAFAVGGAGGLLIGILIGWTMGRGRKAAGEPDSRLENELRQQLTQRDGDLVQLRTELAEAGNARAAAEASRQAAEKILAEQKQLQEQTLRDARAAQDKALADLRDTFKALSAEALKQSAPEFLRLAEQTFGKLQESAKGDLSRGWWNRSGNNSRLTRKICSRAAPIRLPPWAR